jgi:hypothetical protein
VLTRALSLRERGVSRACRIVALPGWTRRKATWIGTLAVAVALACERGENRPQPQAREATQTTRAEDSDQNEIRPAPEPSGFGPLSLRLPTGSGVALPRDRLELHVDATRFAFVGKLALPSEGGEPQIHAYDPKASVSPTMIEELFDEAAYIVDLAKQLAESRGVDRVPLVFVTDGRLDWAQFLLVYRSTPTSDADVWLAVDGPSGITGLPVEDARALVASAPDHGREDLDFELHVVDGRLHTFVRRHREGEPVISLDPSLSSYSQGALLLDDAACRDRPDAGIGYDDIDVLADHLAKACEKSTEQQVVLFGTPLLSVADLMGLLAPDPARGSCRRSLALGRETPTSTEGSCSHPHADTPPPVPTVPARCTMEILEVTPPEASTPMVRRGLRWWLGDVCRCAAASEAELEQVLTFEIERGSETAGRYDGVAAYAAIKPPRALRGRRLVGADAHWQCLNVPSYRPPSRPLAELGVEGLVLRVRMRTGLADASELVSVAP